MCVSSLLETLISIRCLSDFIVKFDNGKMIRFILQNFTFLVKSANIYIQHEYQSFF